MGDEPPLIKFIHIVGQYLFRIQDLRIHFTDKQAKVIKRRHSITGISTSNEVPSNTFIQNPLF